LLTRHVSAVRETTSLSLRPYDVIGDHYHQWPYDVIETALIIAICLRLIYHYKHCTVHYNFTL